MRSYKTRRMDKTLRSPVALLEALEQRAHLSLTNFPQISDLLNPSNSVVRLQTNFGDIDFELFDTAAPITVANFLKYVRDGDFDKMFFHRYAKDQSNNPFVLQGGYARLKAPTTTGTFNGVGPVNQAWEQVPTDAPITNEFNQSNLIRTVAMARQGGVVNSATSQFFINLKNNAFLDTVDQGFTVFGRVATDASWNVVQSIITTVTQTTGQASPFNELPTRNMFDAMNVTEEQLVTVRDAEIIKPQGVAAFYTYRVYYPEGFAGGTINEFLPLGNPGSTALRYQVIVRAETRDALPSPPADFWYRDKVISTGTIQPNTRAGVTMSQFANPAQNLVPKQGKPYAIEVWATGPINAMLSHYDFGSSTIEAFTRTTAVKWTLPDIQKGTSISDFVVWDNTADVPVTVTLTFFKTDGSTPIVITRTTEAFRRGGISIKDTTELVAGSFGLQITSDQPIVAALTHYKTTGADKGGATQLAIAGNGGSRGVLPLAGNGAMGSGVGDTISVLNPGNTPAIVTIIARFDDGSGDFTITSAPLILMAQTRSSFTMPDIAELRGKNFTVLYTSGSANVYLSTLHVEHGDVTANGFAYAAATQHDFAEGFMNAPPRAGTDLFEKIGLFNPNGSFFGQTVQDAIVTVRIVFSDGFVLALDYTLAGDASKFIDLTTLPELQAQVALNRFYYSVNVVSDVPIVAMMSHYDTTLGGVQPSGGGTSIGTQRGQILALV